MYGQPGGGAETAYPLPNFHNEFVAAAKGDMWSASMLFKYGPKGDQWDTSFLAAMSKAVMAWSKTPVPTPQSSERHGYLPRPHQPASDVWYLTRGIEPDLRIAGGRDAGHPNAQRAVIEFDPRLAILGLIQDNKQAARDVMRDRDFVRGILEADWAIQSFAHGQKTEDVSYVAGEAIAAAADVNREEGGREALEAAEAVAAIMAATYDWSTSKQKMTLGVRPDKKLPPGLQAGLRKVAEAYIPDLAYSLANPGTNKNQTDPARHKVVVKDGFPEVVSNNVVVKAFMRSIFSKEVEIAEFRGSVQGHLFNSLWTKGAPEGDQESIDWVVKFLRLVDGLDNGLDLQKAKQEDRDAAQWKAFLDATSSLVGQIPGHGKVATGVKKLVGLTYPLYNAAYKKSANQAKAVKIIRQDNYDRQQYLRVIVTQALIKRGDLKPPANAEWYQDGHVVPGSAFTKWFRENAHKHHMRSGESLRVYAKKLVDVYGKRVP